MLQKLLQLSDHRGTRGMFYTRASAEWSYADYSRVVRITLCARRRVPVYPFRNISPVRVHNKTR